MPKAFPSSSAIAGNVECFYHLNGFVNLQYSFARPSMLLLIGSLTSICLKMSMREEVIVLTTANSKLSKLQDNRPPGRRT